MYRQSHETLRRVEQNDPSLTKLYLGRDGPQNVHCFFSSDVMTFSKDFSRLGTAIGVNTHLKHLAVALTDVGNEFVNGLQRNTSICDLVIGGGGIAGVHHNR